MTNSKSKSMSISLSSTSEKLVRTISTCENRTVTNVVENAVRVFTLMPKELRDRLVEIASEGRTASARFEELSRRLLLELARLQYQHASAALNTSGEIDEEMLIDDEIVIVSSPVT
ncbi:hypothetical protein [Bradyrhizobium liaoningense]